MTSTCELNRPRANLAEIACRFAANKALRKSAKIGVKWCPPYLPANESAQETLILPDYDSTRLRRHCIWCPSGWRGIVHWFTVRYFRNPGGAHSVLNLHLVLTLFVVAFLSGSPKALAFDEAHWQTLMDKGAYCIARNSDSMAKASLEEALTVSDENTPLANHAREQTLVKLGKLCERQRNLYEADQYFKRAFATLQKLNADAEPTLLIEYYERTGRHFFAAQMKQYYDKQNKNQPKPENLTSYMQTLSDKLTKVWTVPKVPSVAQVVCLWCAHNDGKISLLHVDESSGDPTVDASALEAVKRSVPLPPLPPGSPDNTYIQYTFECKPRVPGLR